MKKSFLESGGIHGIHQRRMRNELIVWALIVIAITTFIILTN